MKILFVNERCGWFGGVERNVADTAAALGERGHECRLAFGTDEGRGAAKYAALFDGSHPCLDLAPGRRGNTDTAAGAKAAPFAKILSRVEPDVLYIHKVPDLSFLESFFGRLPAVRMIHDHDLCCPRRHGYTLLGGRICRRPAGPRCLLCGAFLARDRSAPLGLSLRGVAPFFAEMERNRKLGLLLAGSRFMKEELIRNGFAERKIRVLPPVVRTAPAAATPVPEEKRVLYVGQLVRGKGVDLLLRALSRLLVDFSAVIAGDGNARPRLEALSRKLGLAGRVRFAGWVDQAGLSRHYAEARVVAVPSFWAEPFGLVGLEAMNHGRPVAAFAAGGIPDWLEHGVTGLLAPERDVEAFARALEEILSHRSLAAEMGRQGRERFEERFSFADYIDRLERLLKGGRDGKERPPAGGKEHREREKPAAVAGRTP